MAQDAVKFKKLKPIREYLHNKEAMIEQVFSSIPILELKNMVPIKLQGMPLHELKAECVIELLGMSDREIINILDGCKEIYHSSSDSEADGVLVISDDDDTSAQNEEKTTDPSDIICDLTEESRGHTGKKKRKRKDKQLEGEAKKRKPSSSKGQVSSSTNNATKQTSNISRSSEQFEDRGSDKKEKSLLDLLELEMRARAIRSLLKKEDEVRAQKVFSEYKDEPDDIIPIIEEPPQIEILSDSDNDEGTCRVAPTKSHPENLSLTDVEELNNLLGLATKSSNLEVDLTCEDEPNTEDSVENKSAYREGNKKSCRSSKQSRLSGPSTSYIKPSQRNASLESKNVSNSKMSSTRQKELSKPTKKTVIVEKFDIEMNASCERVTNSINNSSFKRGEQLKTCKISKVKLTENRTSTPKKLNKTRDREELSDKKCMRLSKVNSSDVNDVESTELLDATISEGEALDYEDGSVNSADSYQKRDHSIENDTNETIRTHIPRAATGETVLGVDESRISNKAEQSNFVPNSCINPPGDVLVLSEDLENIFDSTCTREKRPRRGACFKAEPVKATSCNEMDATYSCCPNEGRGTDCISVGSCQEEINSNSTTVFDRNDVSQGSSIHQENNVRQSDSIDKKRKVQVRSLLGENAHTAQSFDNEELVDRTSERGMSQATPYKNDGFSQRLTTKDSVSNNELQRSALKIRHGAPPDLRGNDIGESSTKIGSNVDPNLALIVGSSDSDENSVNATNQKTKMKYNDISDKYEQTREMQTKGNSKNKSHTKNVNKTESTASRRKLKKKCTQILKEPNTLSDSDIITIDNSSNEDENLTQTLHEAPAEILELDDSDDAITDWTTRWLGSKHVQNVVKTSKILTTARKKLKQKLKGTDAQRGVSIPITSSGGVPNLIGSVEEYRLLIKEGKIKSALAETPSHISTEIVDIKNNSHSTESCSSVNERRANNSEVSTDPCKPDNETRELVTQPSNVEQICNSNSLTQASNLSSDENGSNLTEPDDQMSPAIQGSYEAVGTKVISSTLAESCDSKENSLSKVGDSGSAESKSPNPTGKGRCVTSKTQLVELASVDQSLTNKNASLPDLKPKTNHESLPVNRAHQKISPAPANPSMSVNVDSTLQMYDPYYNWVYNQDLRGSLNGEDTLSRDPGAVYKKWEEHYPSTMEACQVTAVQASKSGIFESSSRSYTLPPPGNKQSYSWVFERSGGKPSSQVSHSLTSNPDSNEREIGPKENTDSRKYRYGLHGLLKEHFVPSKTEELKKCVKE